MNNLEVPQAKKTRFRALPQVLSDEQSLDEVMLIDVRAVSQTSYHFDRMRKPLRSSCLSLRSPRPVWIRMEIGECQSCILMRWRPGNSAVV